MKPLLAFLLAAIALSAQTTVTGTLVTPTGDRVSGTCDFQAVSQFTTPGGQRVVGPRVSVAFTSGSLSVDLLPTDTAAPSSYYNVFCASPAQTVAGRKIQPFTWTLMHWLVPTNASAVDISTVITAQPPAPSILIPPAQINAASLSTGTYCLNVVNGVITGLVACSSGGGALSWATMSSSTWAALTSSQWATLTN